MNENEIQQVTNGLKEISKKPTPKIIKESFYILFPKEMGNKRCVFTIIIAIVISVIIGFFYDNSYEIIGLISDKMLEIQIELFGWIFTGYSIFQALLSPKIIFLMCSIKVENEKESIFLQSNKYYISYLIIDSICIALSFLIAHLSVFIPLDWNLLQSVFMNNCLFSAILFGYIYICIVSFTETIYFVCNVYRMYSIAASEKYMEEAREIIEKNK